MRRVKTSSLFLQNDKAPASMRDNNSNASSRYVSLAKALLYLFQMGRGRLFTHHLCRQGNCSNRRFELMCNIRKIFRKKTSGPARFSSRLIQLRHRFVDFILQFGKRILAGRKRTPPLPVFTFSRYSVSSSMRSFSLLRQNKRRFFSPLIPFPPCDNPHSLPSSDIRADAPFRADVSL